MESGTIISLLSLFVAVIVCGVSVFNSLHNGTKDKQSDTKAMTRLEVHYEQIQKGIEEIKMNSNAHERRIETQEHKLIEHEIKLDEHEKRINKLEQEQ